MWKVGLVVSFLVVEPKDDRRSYYSRFLLHSGLLKQNVTVESYDSRFLLHSGLLKQKMTVEVIKVVFLYILGC